MNIAIVDYEINSQKQLEEFIKETEELKLVGSYRSTNSFLAAIKEKQMNFDLLFLNIELPKYNGLQLARMLLEIQANIDIVFVSSKKRYAVEAFELNALDYLLKPLSKKRFQKVISKFLERNQVEL